MWHWCQVFANMPENLDELDEAVHSLQTRIDCLAAVDNAVSLFTSVWTDAIVFSISFRCFLLLLGVTAAAEWEPKIHQNVPIFYQIRAILMKFDVQCFEEIEICYKVMWMFATSLKWYLYTTLWHLFMFFCQNCARKCQNIVDRY